MVRKSGSRRRTAVVAGVLGLALVGGAAFAYWTWGGGGTGATTTKATLADIVVTQTASLDALAPGESVPLSGLLTNPNNTDVKVGTLTATITGVTGGAAVGDFTVSGPVIVNAIVTKATPVPWSGMTLDYANSAVNQDNGKGATVTIEYTLTPFQENALPPLGTFRVLVIDGVRTFDIYVGGGLPVSPFGAQILPGDTLRTYDNNAVGEKWSADLATADASGNIRYVGPVPVPGHVYYIAVFHPGDTVQFGTYSTTLS